MDAQARQRRRRCFADEEFSSTSTPASRSPQDWAAETSSSSIKSHDELGGEEADEGFPSSSDEATNMSRRRRRRGSRRSTGASNEHRPMNRSASSSNSCSSRSDTSSSSEAGLPGRPRRNPGSSTSNSDAEGVHAGRQHGKSGARQSRGAQSGTRAPPGSRRESGPKEDKHSSHRSTRREAAKHGDHRNHRHEQPRPCRNVVDSQAAKRLLRDLLSIRISVACELEDLFKELGEGAKISISDVPNSRIRKKLRHLLAVFHCKTAATVPRSRSSTPSGNGSECAVFYASQKCHGTTLRRILRQLLREVASEMNISRAAIKAARAEDDEIVGDLVSVDAHRRGGPLNASVDGAAISIGFDEDHQPLSLTEMRARGLFDHVVLAPKQQGQLSKPDLPWGVSKMEQRLESFRTEMQASKSQQKGEQECEPWVRFNRDEVFGKCALTSAACIREGTRDYNSLTFSGSSLEARFKTSQYGL